MVDSLDPRSHLGTVASNDAFADQPAGTMFYLSTIKVGSVQAGASPLTVTNWEVFEGSLLAVCFKYGDTLRVEGTAVMIGMGLAFSAKHVLADHLEALTTGDAELICFGVRPSGIADIWKCYAHSADDTSAGDLNLLCLKLVSEWVPDRHFKVLPLTTRIPPPGETLTVVGFRFDEVIPRDSVDGPTRFPGLLYVSKGSAGEFSYPIHDSVLAPFPTIEVLSGSLGGMSGGAVLDVKGRLVGITSLGLSSDDEPGPTLAAWWMTAVFWRTTLMWPPGVYPDQSAILWEMPTVAIYGREDVQLLDEPNFRYVLQGATEQSATASADGERSPWARSTGPGAQIT